MTQRLVSAARALMLSAALFSLAVTITPRVARAAGEVGSVAANFTIANVLAGPSTVTLNEYAGSVVCIAFFAEW